MFKIMIRSIVTYTKLVKLARLKRPSAAFLLNGAITRPATITKTFTQTHPSYMQSFIKIHGVVLEKSGIKILTMCNFNKDGKFVQLKRSKNG